MTRKDSSELTEESKSLFGSTAWASQLALGRRMTPLNSSRADKQMENYVASLLTMKVFDEEIIRRTTVDNPNQRQL